MDAHQLYHLLNIEDDQYRVYIEYFYQQFLTLQPETVQHYVPSVDAPHQERTVLAHTILALQVLQQTDRFKNATPDDQFIMILTVMLHDVGKCLIWHRLVRNGAILDGSQPWNFRGRDVVGASWFKDHVINNNWSMLQFNPVYYGIWFSLVNQVDNQQLVRFLPTDLLEIINYVDIYGMAETIASLPQPAIVPNVKVIASSLPYGAVVIYILGPSGSGKTYMARNLYYELQQLGISCEYVSFDRTLLHHNGYTDIWADINPTIRGTGIRDTKSPYYQCYQQHRKDPSIVSNLLTTDMEKAVQNKQVVIFTSTVLKPTYRKLPFYSSQFTAIVTSPDRQLDGRNTSTAYFANYDTTMGANCRFRGFASPGPLLYVPAELVNSCIQYLVNFPRFENRPPMVKSAMDLPALTNYLYTITGSVEGVKAAVSHYYGVTPKTYIVGQGEYLNLSYQADANYSDIYNPGCPSPAIYCRGTTLYFDGREFTVIRLPMNRGKEVTSIANDTQVSLSDDNDDLEGAHKCSEYFTQILQSVNSESTIYSPKIDGTLIIVCLDKYGLNMDLYNNYKICIGTAGKLILSESNKELLVQALNAVNMTIDDFAKQCYDFMMEKSALTLTFELVAGVRPKVVTLYPEEKWGLYFLGCTMNNVFRPYYQVEQQVFRVEAVREIGLGEARKMLLGPFPDHVEGSVVWALYEGQYYPLKMKTTMYYWLHKQRFRPEYTQYILDMVETYGWILPVKPTRQQLDRAKPGPYIMALIDLPPCTIAANALLSEARSRQQHIHSLMEVRREEIDEQTYKDVRRYMNIYIRGRYELAYRWF